jgi:two-component system sensor histidine kinase VicK
MIRSNADRLEGFVKDLLQIAKIQNEDILVQRQTIELSSLIRSLVSNYRIQAERKSVELEFKSNEKLHASVDPDKIEQIFSNVLSNAIKFSKCGTVSVSAERQNGGLVCSVRDQGCGVPQKDLNRIFERFYQGTHAGKGAGIGLAIAKGWVEAHGGRIWAESEGEGKGTTVTFTLPAGNI